MSRSFNTNQRVALYLSSQGKCGICGTTLKPGWHADHKQPYSKGGNTDVINGQALCPVCNLKKGAKSLNGFNQWPEHPLLRDWQLDAFNQFRAMDNVENFLLVACPGAGKSLFTAKVAHSGLISRHYNRVIIVCPTSSLKKQWARTFLKAGMDIDPTWQASDGGISSDNIGIVVTYAAVAANPQSFKMLCKPEHKVLVVFDECHHVGDDKSWGMAITQAFGYATKRLLLSGTPFREDKTPIPYVTYEEVKQYDRTILVSKADFAYGYGASLSDRDVVRNVVFTTFDGEQEWYSDGAILKHGFQDKLTETLARQRLGTALTPHSGWMETVIRAGHKKLTEIRNSSTPYNHPNAGGLIIAMDKYHARQYAEMVKEITGKEPVVVLSGDKDDKEAFESSSKITAFDEGTDEWIIAVRMVSEGVDIPRLRVLIYATDIMTETFFIQALGRIIRYTKELEEQTAYFYLPNEEILKTYAQRIKEIQAHQIQIDEEEIEREIKERENPIDHDFQPRMYNFIHSDGQEADYIFNHNTYTPQFVDEFMAKAASVGVPKDVPFSSLVEFVKLFGIDPTGANDTTYQNPQPKTPSQEELLSKKKARYKLAIKRLVSQVAISMAGEGNKPSEKVYQHLYYRLNQIDGVQKQVNCTLEQLQNRYLTLKKWLGDKGIDISEVEDL
jgi:superfamily II DNA or RNA helicase